MNDKSVLPLILLVAYITFITGMAVDSVGDVVKCDDHVYSWELPFTVLAVVLFPTVLGFVIGNTHKEDLP